MKNNLFKLLSGLALISLLAAACGGAATTAAPATVAPATAVPVVKDKICEVTDTGGVDDKSFNQTAWAGAEAVAADLGWEAVYLESQQQTDYEKNLTEFLASNCTLIVTVGFLLGDATSASALANPDQNYMILDFAYADPHDNVWQQVYSTDQGAFLAGYVAASVTQTGKVGTFGGINIPPVVDFMKGYEFGVQYYNAKHGTDVEVLGWSTAANDGLFTGNFDSLDDGRRMAETLMDEGADVILPVAGPVGLGSAAAIQERGSAWLVGVDTDWTVSAPEYADITLTSVLKRLELSVQTAARAVADGSFAGGLHVGNLANGEIGIAESGGYLTAVSDEVKAELEDIKAAVIAGEISTNGQPTNPFKVCEVTDTGGVDDKSFNQTAWAGAEAAATALGGEAVFLESQQQTDYEKNITEFLNSDCDLIVTVGFLLGDATGVAAPANPDQKFQILDVNYLGDLPNVWQQAYATEQGAFLAGYVAAAVTQSGKVGTFGGINIPPVADFMVGYQEGVEYYNSVKGTSVEVLGWDNAAKDGLFTGNFDSLDDGRRMAETLMDEGADVILPVAGPVGLGTAAAIQERGGAWLIGVDTDWTVSAPEYADITLTSVLKHLELSVQAASRAVATGSFTGAVHLGNLKNDEVGIAPITNIDQATADALTAEVAGVAKDIIDGKIVVHSFSTLP